MPWYYKKSLNISILLFIFNLVLIKIFIASLNIDKINKKIGLKGIILYKYNIKNIYIHTLNKFKIR